MTNPTNERDEGKCKYCLAGNSPWWDQAWMHTVDGSNLDCSGNYPEPRTPSGQDFYEVIMNLGAEKSALEERVKLLERACSKTNEEVCQSLGKVLGYPWFKDDQKNFPDATEENGVCVGEHVAESISEEAAKKIVALEERVRKLEAHKPDYSDPRYETLNDRIRENRELSEINKRQKEEITRLKYRNEELEGSLDVALKSGEVWKKEALSFKAENERLRELANTCEPVAQKGEPLETHKEAGCD